MEIVSVAVPGQVPGFKSIVFPLTTRLSKLIAPLLNWNFTYLSNPTLFTVNVFVPNCNAWADPL